MFILASSWWQWYSRCKQVSSVILLTWSHAGLDYVSQTWFPLQATDEDCMWLDFPLSILWPRYVCVGGGSGLRWGVCQTLEPSAWEIFLSPQFSPFTSWQGQWWFHKENIYFLYGKDCWEVGGGLHWFTGFISILILQWTQVSHLK